MEVRRKKITSTFSVCLPIYLSYLLVFSIDHLLLFSTKEREREREKEREMWKKKEKDRTKKRN